MRISVRAATQALLMKCKFEGAPQLKLQAVDLCCGTGTHVHAHVGRLRNRIHRSSAANDADVKRSFRRGRDACLRKNMDSASEHNDGVGNAKVAPGMPAGATDSYFKAAAAKSFRNNGVSSGSVEHDARGYSVIPFVIGKDVAHAAQVAFSFLANVADKEQRSRMRKVEVG